MALGDGLGLKGREGRPTWERGGMRKAWRGSERMGGLRRRKGWGAQKARLRLRCESCKSLFLQRIPGSRPYWSSLWPTMISFSSLLGTAVIPRFLFWTTLSIPSAGRVQAHSSTLFPHRAILPVRKRLGHLFRAGTCRAATQFRRTPSESLRGRRDSPGTWKGRGNCSPTRWLWACADFLPKCLVRTR